MRLLPSVLNLRERGREEGEGGRKGREGGRGGREGREGRGGREKGREKTECTCIVLKLVVNRKTECEFYCA